MMRGKGDEDVNDDFGGIIHTLMKTYGGIDYESVLDLPMYVAFMLYDWCVHDQKVEWYKMQIAPRLF